MRAGKGFVGHQCRIAEEPKKLENIAKNWKKLEKIKKKNE